MPAPDNEPKALAANILSEIISAVKQSTPTRTTDKATQGFVYSQLRVGQMISPRDFGRAWNPVGGNATTATQQPPADGTATPPDPSRGEAVKRGVQATMNTEALVDTMLVITDDGTLQTYTGGGRHLSFAYKSILDAMEPGEAPERTQAEIDRNTEAGKVLSNDDGTDTVLYKTYKANQLAYAKAKSDYVVAQARFLADPTNAELAPMLLAPFQVAVEQARHQWKAQGADAVETALATRESLGVPLEQGAIMNARKLFDNWNLPLLGVPAEQPFSYVLPSEWAQADIDDIGWTTITVSSSDYQNHFERHGYELHTANWRGESQSSSGEAGVGIFGFGFNGDYSEAKSNSSRESTNVSTDGTRFNNDAKNLSVSLQYGLCSIARPWLLTDLFHLKNWHIVNGKAGCISSGKIDDQIGAEDPLLPLIPTHFLIIRNVRISAEHWNSDGQVLSQWNSKFTADAEQHQSTVGGGVEVPVFGPLSLDFGASHSESGYSGSYRDEAGHDYSNDYKAHFDGTTLEIRGAQIVAWLSEVVPHCPPLDDPNLNH
jgi:hypothetical protein